MARKLVKRFTPNPEWIKQHQSLQFLGTWLHDPNIWHLNRYSVSGAFFIGLFVAFLPLPGQMLIAATAAILVRVNLPISVSLVWITNPLTMAPIFYFAYKIGALITGKPPVHFDFELSWQWITEELASNLLPFLVGCLVCGLFSGLLGSTTIRVLWRYYVIHKWHERRLRRQQGNQS